MEAQVLKGHLDTLLLATVQSGAEYGYAIREALRVQSGVAGLEHEGPLRVALGQNALCHRAWNERSSSQRSGGTRDGVVVRRSGLDRRTRRLVPENTGLGIPGAAVL